MDFLTKPLMDMEEYESILKAIKNGSTHVGISGPSESQRAHFTYSICRQLGTKGLFIAHSEIQARKFFEDFSFFFGEEVVFFPPKEVMLHDVEAKSYDAVFQRISALDKIALGNFKLIVTSAEAVSHKLVPRNAFEQGTFHIVMGDRLELTVFSQHLVSIGYERVGAVEGKGQYAVRGGIIDVFPVSSELPVRIELFDDEIDSIRSFNIETQRSIDKLDSVRIVPAREMIYPQGKRDAIIEKIQADAHEYIRKIGKSPELVKKVENRVRSDIEKMNQQYYFSGMDRYIPHIMDESALLTDYTDSEVAVFIDEPQRFKQRMENLQLEHEEICKSLMEKGEVLPKSFEMLLEYEGFIHALKNQRLVYMSTFPMESGQGELGRRFSVPASSLGSYQGHIDMLIKDIQSLKERSKKIVVLSGTRGRGERFLETLRAEGIEAVYSQDFGGEVMPGQIVITHGTLNKGFEYPSLNLVVVSDREAFGRDRKLKKGANKRRGRKIDVFTDLNIGDFVVHQAHGIGQYVGIQKLAVDNVKKDYLKIQYQDGAYLYIPTNQLDLIQKYIGSEGKTPRLNKLGGAEWAKTKAKVRESLKEIAEELIRLYAKRQSLEGYVYSRDTIWQRQFEELFPYEETDDQLKCIEEIKSDMESGRPMDRLLCGDVGYGKTEVAIRAIFKAVMGGKQVAYLVPTTVLAQQHYNNFKERMKDFPVTVEVMSRFRTQAEQRRILKDVKAGVVDVLVGTHRLIQKDIQFKDLGLLVVDEEQRFGVTHKEKLKNLKTNVDVLTLTATPIPRTLHMSLVGIRDISTLEDPPEERYPVQTYVMEYNPDVIRDAIERELARNGQVFYLYNRVRTIQIKASEIQALIPDAKVAVAHGQMDERQLEDVMYSFINGEYNVLVCTTIIESGLDMPNVNTIIVEDADKMGLAQLYQLRGRVGRSNRLAYAYITYKKDKVLSEIAEKRLQAIKEFTEFGSGFKIAMRDMEIRGAGNLLGAQQHGHMETVGYDMYCKLLDEAVKELKGETFIEDNEEITIDINVSAYIDDTYIGSESQKIEMYKKIASIQDEQDAADVEDELIDRYGDLPGPVNNLIQIAFIKTLARECGFISIQEKNESILFQYKEGYQVNLGMMGRLMDKYKRKLLFTASNKPYITLKLTGIARSELLQNIKIMLQDVKKLQES